MSSLRADRREAQLPTATALPVRFGSGPMSSAIALVAQVRRALELVRLALPQRSAQVRYAFYQLRERALRGQPAPASRGRLPGDQGFPDGRGYPAGLALPEDPEHRQAQALPNFHIL